MEDKIKKIIIEITEDPELEKKITMESDLLNEVSLNSSQMMRFILKIEDEFGIVIDFDNFSPTYLSSLSSFCNFVAEQVQITQS